MTRSTSRRHRWYWLSILLLLAFWEIVARRLDQEIIIPSLVAVGRELFEIVSSAEGWSVIAATLARIAFTFTADLILALILGTAAGLAPALEDAIRPIESATRSVPTMGIVLLALIWLDSELAPLFVTSLIIFPILYRSTVDGIHNIDPALEEFHSVHRVSLRKRLRHFYIPSLMPFLRTGAVASLGLGFKVMITAEVLSQPNLAIGTVFQIERSRLNTAAVMAWCIFVIAASSLFELILKRLGKRPHERVLEVNG